MKNIFLQGITRRCRRLMCLSYSWGDSDLTKGNLFTVRTINQWNPLPTVVVPSPTVNVLKIQLDEGEEIMIFAIPSNLLFYDSVCFLLLN